MEFTFEATNASKQPQRSDLTSDLKFMAKTTYATMFLFRLFLPILELRLRKKMIRRIGLYYYCRVVGFDFERM